MFFVVQSNDSFNFPLGWRKYIVNCYLTADLHSGILSAHLVTWHWPNWFPLWDSQCTQYTYLLELIPTLSFSVHTFLRALISTLRFWMHTIHTLERVDFHFWDSHCIQLLERADFHFEMFSADNYLRADFHFEIFSADNYLDSWFPLWDSHRRQLLGQPISTLRFSMHTIHTLTWESWFPLWDSQSWFSPPWPSAVSHAFHCRILKNQQARKLVHGYNYKLSRQAQNPHRKCA